MDIPLVGMPLQRGVSTDGQRNINVIFEKTINPLTKGESLSARKRPGQANNTQPPGTTGTGRGIHFWEGTGALYTVIDNKIYSGVTDLGVTLAASTGRVFFAETTPTSSARLLIVSDGTDNYHITTGDVCTQIDENDDAQYPTANVGSIVFFNSYIFQAQENGNIWNTDPDDFTAWTGTAVEDADSYGDELVAIARTRDQLVIFGKYSTEFYIDNGTTPTPLLRLQQNSLRLGMAHKNTMAQAGDSLVWVAEAPAHGEGGRSIWLMEGTEKTIKISTPVIDRFVTAEGTNISGSSAWMERIDGHLLYVLNLSSAARTFVYDLDMQMWCEWRTSSDAVFNIIGVTSQNGVVYGLDATTGRTVTFSSTTYRDGGAEFTVRLQTDSYDFGTPFIKFQTGLWLVADNQASQTVSISESDDDYANFNTARTLSLTNTRKFLAEGGAFFKRAYRVDYAANTAFRAEKLVVNLEIGDV